MPPAIWYQLQLISILEESSNTNRYFFNLLSTEPFNFEPGQFLTCDLPIGEKRAQRWRSYSIANADQKNNQIELCISYKAGGLASDYFFNKIKAGDTFNVKGPEGNFILPEDNKLNLFFICTGTGMVPFHSMLQSIEPSNIRYNSIHLIYGTRKTEDIIYQEDMQQWCTHLANFNCHICLSRESVVPESKLENQTYHTGYVHDVYQQILKESRFPVQQNYFMICGWSEMIDQATEKLFLELKFTRDQIKFELYG